MSRGKQGVVHKSKVTKEKCRQYHYKERYNISIKDYDILLAKQENHCALCHITPELNGKRLYVDHNHVNGKIRGLLCIHCNALIELYYNTHPKYSAILEYLKRGM